MDLSAKDCRFVTVWSPENRNIVDAYLKGYSTAYANGHEIIIEMDAGLSTIQRVHTHVLEGIERRE